MEFKLFASCLIEKDKRFLLVQESKTLVYGKWNLPGGHTELGESFLQTASREVREEANVEPELTGIVAVQEKINQNHGVIMIFTGRIKQGEPVAGGEISQVKWFAAEEILNMKDEELLDGYRVKTVVKKYLAGEIVPISTLI